MAPRHSLSLRKLSDLLFEDAEPASDGDADDERPSKPLAGEDFVSCRFERAVSEDTTVPGQPFSRSISPEGSDDELEHAAHRRLEAFPQFAHLFQGPTAISGEEVDRSQELIAVGPTGEAHFVPQEELAELEALRACFDEEATPLILVARDGSAFFEPDGDHVDWEKLDALRAGARDETVVSPSPSLASDYGVRARQPRSLCPTARSLAPLQLEEEKLLGAEPPAVRLGERLEASVPRRPSLKRLAKLLFTLDGGAADCRGDSPPPEVEEMELDVPGVPSAAFEVSPQTTYLLPTPVADTRDEERDRSEELIAVGRDGEAFFVPEEQLPAIEALRALLEEEPSPLILVARDGAAYLAPDGDNVAWDELDARRAAGHKMAVASSPQRFAGDGRRAQLSRPLCPAARALAPLQLEEAKAAVDEPAADLRRRRPEGSVPRSPSLKRLSALLFAQDDEEDTADSVGDAREGAEELELEVLGAWRAVADDEARQRGSLGQRALGCSLQ